MREIIIKIDEETYNNFVIKNEYSRLDVIAVHNALVNGINQETGYWIEHEIKDTGRWLTCSRCGREWINKKENFCPSCGRRMVECKAESEGGINEIRNSF